MPKRQLPLQADLIINRLRWEAIVDRQLDAFDVDDDAPHVPSTDPLSNPQSRRKLIHVSRIFFNRRGHHCLLPKRITSGDHGSPTGSQNRQDPER